MHLHVLPAGKMSSKTVVGNLLDYLVLKFGFPKRIHGALEEAEFTSNFIRKSLKNPTSHTAVNCPQIKKVSSQLSWLYWGFYWFLHDFIRQEVGLYLCLEGGEGLVMHLCFMWKSLKHTQWRCISLTFKLWIYLWGPRSSCWEIKTAEERSFWTHIKIFEKSDGEVESTGTRSAALLSGVSQREADLAN